MNVRILMVCLGNICRSPLAEGILQSKLDPKMFQVHSCGTSNYHIGSKPDQRSIEIAKKHSIDITHQRAAQFKVENFDTYDFIYAMDSTNYKNIIKLSRKLEDKNKVSLVMEESYPNMEMNIPDPYYSEKQGFEDVYQMLNDACDKIALKLKELHY